MELLAASLNGSGYMVLSGSEFERFESAFDSGDEEAFCRLFGQEEIVDNLEEFLGEFMIHKVIAGQELLRAAGTVSKALVRWQPSDVMQDPRALRKGDLVDGSLQIERVEPDALRFEGGIGPLNVPTQASALAQVGWRVTVVLARAQGVWHLIEFGNVRP